MDASAQIALTVLFTSLTTWIVARADEKLRYRQLNQEWIIHQIQLKHQIYTDSISAFTNIASTVAIFADINKPIEETAKLLFEHNQNLFKLRLLTDVDILEPLLEYNELSLTAYLNMAIARNSLIGLIGDEYFKGLKELHIESMLTIQKLLDLSTHITLLLKADYGYPSVNADKYKSLVSQNSIRSIERIRKLLP